MDIDRNKKLHLNEQKQQYHSFQQITAEQINNDSESNINRALFGFKNISLKPLKYASKSKRGNKERRRRTKCHG